MKLGQLTECNMTNNFFQKYAEKGAGRLVVNLFFFFFKSFTFSKSKWSAPQLRYTIKTIFKTFQTSI